MKNAFIIHGAFGSPEENWIPWLKHELEAREYRVFTPEFPTPEGQNYDNWMAVAEPYFGEFNSETVLIGHSIGATFALCILEQLHTQIRKTILASGFLGLLDNKTFDEINHTISDRAFNWNTIRRYSKEFAVFHGDDDPNVPISKAEALAQMLGTTPKLIPSGGHLNADAGFTEFKELLDEIQ